MSASTFRSKIIAVVATGLMSVLPAGVALADTSNSGAYGTTFVDGAGDLGDDFGDHYGELGHSLCNGCSDSWNTDLVVLWQTILFAEGFLSCSGIDGQFGSGTAVATKKWQSRYYLAADGQVGAATWAMADQFLTWQDSQLNSYVFYDSPLNAGWLQFYRGDYHKLHDGGAYELIQAAAPDGAWASFDAPRIHFHQRTITRFLC